MYIFSQLQDINGPKLLKLILDYFPSYSGFISSHHFCRFIYESLMLDFMSVIPLINDFFFLHLFSNDGPFLFQHAHRVPSSQPKVQVCVSSALLTAAPRLRLPLFVCAAMVITAGTVISQMNPAPVSTPGRMLHTHNMVLHGIIRFSSLLSNYHWVFE